LFSFNKLRFLLVSRSSLSLVFDATALAAASITIAVFLIAKKTRSLQCAVAYGYGW
jgi:hypothetical protein